MKKNVAIVVMAILIVSMGVIIWVADYKISELRKGWAKTEIDLADAKDQEQIEAFLRYAVVLYSEGKKKEGINCLQYALYKMEDQSSNELGLLPAKMLKDPEVKKLLENLLVKKPAKKATKKMNILDLHKRSGLGHKVP